jgi:hypothetical protein
MKEEIFVLDCKPNGIVAVKPDTDEIIKFGKFKEYYVFRNKHLLEVELYKSGIFDYDLGFILEGKFIPYKKVQQIAYDMYQFIDGETIVSIIPTTREILFRCGYFAFYEDPTERINDQLEGWAANRKVYSIVKEAAAQLFKAGVFKSTTMDPSFYPYGGIYPFKYATYESSLNIRIMRVMDIIKINEYRRNCNEIALPFKPEMDKYKNIYFCFSRDESDYNKKACYELSKDITDYMLEFIKTNYPEIEVKVLDTKYGQYDDHNIKLY